MKSLSLTTVFLCLCAFSSFAQNNYSIKGIATDTVSKAAIPVTVTVLNAKDSILRKFTYAGADGSFAMNGLPAGRFLLLVTYPDYADYATVFTLNPANREHNFGNIKMSHEATMLKEVNIKSEVTAIKIKGDTIEFNAKAYVVQPNDKVEDLLKQLPGITIDKDGHIKSGGEIISKVLLDGEEFFGDDPTLITRNIRGDMVDKIQLYDKKSDQATFTGVDDGKTQRVINVQLKQDKRTGVFGKVLGGEGNDGYYEGQGFVNKFTTQYKAAAYGTLSNDGKVGLGAADNSRLGMNNLMVIMAGGANIVASAGNSPLDRESYNGRGLPETQTGGVHYDSKWNKNTESINANYKIGNLSSTTDQNTITQTSFPTSIQNTVDNSHVVNNLFRQKVDALYTNTSPTSNLRVDMNGTLLHTHDYSTDASTSTQADTLLNRYNKSSDVKTDEKTFNTNIFYSKRFKKQGSGISVNLQEAYDQSKSTNYINYDSYNTVTKDSITNQYKPTDNSGLAFAGRVTYNQLIFKKVSMVLNYEATINNSTSDQKSYNQSSPGVYNLLDTALSNNYKLNQFNNQLGVAFNYNTPKTNFNVGTGANDVSFKQTNLNTAYVYKRNYINWSPRASFLYRVGTSKSLQLSYSGSSSQPSISQVQPVPNNLNPESITIGNPDLKPTFSNYITGFYNSFQQLTGQSFNVRGSATFVNNNIINKQSRDDATGKIINQYVNLNGKTTYGFNLDVAYSKKITALDMQATIDAYTNQSRNYLYSNNVLTRSDDGYSETEFTLRKDKLKKYTLSLSVVPNWNTYDYSPVTTQPNSVAFNWNIRSSAVVYLPAKFQIGSTLSDKIRGKVLNEPGTVNTDWDATISKTFLKTDELKLLLTCNNILDQEGFNRSNSTNSISQSTYNTIRRFFMLSISWDFAHFPTIPVKQ